MSACFPSVTYELPKVYVFTTFLPSGSVKETEGGSVGSHKKEIKENNHTRVWEKKKRRRKEPHESVDKTTPEMV